MLEPNSYEELGELVRQGFTDWSSLGEVNAIEYRGCILFNYTGLCQITNRWNWFERVSRGLVYEKHTGKLLGRCMPKFWNYGERLPAEDAFIVEATEKLDGSMILIWRHDGFWRTSTRGSFTSEQAEWAMLHMVENCHADKLDPAYTYVCEAIYPENRVVVGYGARRELCLLAAINTETGEELAHYQLDFHVKQLGFGRPKRFSFDNVAEYLAAAEKLSANEEGWVLKYSDGSRFKVKGTAYKLAHKLLSGLTPKRMVELLMADDGVRGLYDLLKGLPDEFYHEFKQMADDLYVRAETLRRYATDVFTEIDCDDRKTFAEAAKLHPAISHCLFALKDGKKDKVMTIIYKSMLSEMKDPVIE